MSSNGKSPNRCDSDSCQIPDAHCHINDHDDCGIEHPHCHVCLFDKAADRPSMKNNRNETQPGSIKYQQMKAKDEQRNAGLNLGREPSPDAVYHSAQWQPSYAMGGGTDLTKMLRPTGHRTFSWGGPGSNVSIPSPEDSRSSSAPESRGGGSPRRPQVLHTQSSRMREMLRKRLDERLGPSGTPQQRGGLPTVSSPMSTSPVQTPPADEPELGGEGERMTGKTKTDKSRMDRSKGKKSERGIMKNIGKGASKGLKKARGKSH